MTDEQFANLMRQLRMIAYALAAVIGLFVVHVWLRH
jgi:hypothetical protein